MRTTAYWRTVLAVILLCHLLAEAQSFCHLPAADFRSTSAMSGMHVTLPVAAQTGVLVTGDEPGTYAPAAAAYTPGRAADNPFGDDTVEGTDNPREPGSPIGDAAGPLCAMALGYLIYRRRKRCAI